VSFVIRKDIKVVDKTGLTKRNVKEIYMR